MGVKHTSQGEANEELKSAAHIAWMPVCAFEGYWDCVFDILFNKDDLDFSLDGK